MKTGEEKDVIEKKDVTAPSTAPIRPEDGGDNDETSVTPGEGRSEAPSERSKPFPQTPDTFLKARAEPEFVGEQRRETFSRLFVTSPLSSQLHELHYWHADVTPSTLFLLALYLQSCNATFAALDELDELELIQMNFWLNPCA